MQGIPSFAAPPLGDFSAFQDDMIQPQAGQAVAGGQACLAAADNDAIRLLCHGSGPCNGTRLQIIA